MELQYKDYVVILSKSDLLDSELESEYAQEMKLIFKDIPHLIVSSITRHNLNELKEILWKVLNE